MEKGKIDEVIEHLKVVGNLGFNHGEYCRIYSMTTENIYGFLKKYDLRGKKVLTVGASGDQRLNSYLMEASDVTCFDINPLTELHIKLKDAALKLNYEEFLNFFRIYGTNYKINYTFLDYKLFDKISDYLDEDALYFYDYVINKQCRFLEEDIYFCFDDNLGLMKKMNNYLEEDSYYKLQSIMKDKKVRFINSSIDDLVDTLNGEKFDIILLSNISDYIHNFYLDGHLERYREIIDKLISNLNDGGVIQVGYIYCFYHKGEDISDFHLKDCRNIYFPNDIFSIDYVDSYVSKGNYDKVITYKKVN